MHIKTVMRYHIIPTRMAITTEKTVPSIGKHTEKLEPSYAAGGNVK